MPPPTISIAADPSTVVPEFPEPLGFGQVFTDRVFVQHHSRERGWYDAKIVAASDLPLNPATAVFHVGQAIFEGTKAYRRSDGRVNLFRLDRNIKRFNLSAARLAMPQVDAEFHREAIHTLLREQLNWVPRQPDAALYIRPVMIGTDSTLQVRASHSYLHYVMLSPAGPYFTGTLKPVSVLVSHEYVRAARGGTGEAKTTANYAVSLYAIEMARAQGYQQVLWLDAAERRYVEEVGAMNIAFVYDGKHISTPALSGSILHGVTRDSILRLAPDLGYSVSEDRIDVEAMLADLASGKITEVFAMGTAAVVAPVDRIGYRGKDYTVRDAETGQVTQTLHRALTDIQFGRAPDPYGWTTTLSIPQGAETAPVAAVAGAR